MPITVILDVRVRPEALDELTAFMAEILPDTRTYPGCRWLVSHQDADEPTHLVFIEEWESREDYAAYLEWRLGMGGPQRLAALAAVPPTITYLMARPDL